MNQPDDPVRGGYFTTERRRVDTPLPHSAFWVLQVFSRHGDRLIYGAYTSEEELRTVCASLRSRGAQSRALPMRR
jgi:hypothetical protein